MEKKPKVMTNFRRNNNRSRCMTMICSTRNGGLRIYRAQLTILRIWQPCFRICQRSLLSRALFWIGQTIMSSKLHIMLQKLMCIQRVQSKWKIRRPHSTCRRSVQESYTCGVREILMHRDSPMGSGPFNEGWYVMPVQKGGECRCNAAKNTGIEIWLPKAKAADHTTQSTRDGCIVC